MSTPSPLDGITNGIVCCNVKIDGILLNDQYSISLINVNDSLNKNALAEIVLRGDEGSDFHPGQSIEISAGYDEKASTIFTGNIVKYGIDLDILDGFNTRIVCNNKLITSFNELSSTPVLKLVAGDTMLSFSAEFNAELPKENAILGTVKFQGSALVKPCNLIELAGVGKFNGTAIVSAVSHTIKDGNWITTIGFGIEQKSIEIKDQNGNIVKLSPSGIDLTSPNDINMKASGNISLSANGKINVDATQDLTVSGLNINAHANIGFTAKGNASAEISASGQTTVKGGIVMIN